MSTIDQQKAAASVGRAWWLLLFLGVVSTVVGVVVMVHPAGSTYVLAILIGIWLLVSGIFSLARAFSSEVGGGLRVMLIISGVLSLILALLMFRYSPEEKIELVGIFAGIAFLFNGIGALFASSEEKEGRGYRIFTGIVYLIGGMVLIAYPASVSVFVWVIGIWLVVIGIFEIISSFMVRSAAKKLSA